MATHSFVSIVGPTATGKTSLALELAQELIAVGLAQTVDLISADSRQVYKGLEITTGVDLPAEFTLHSIKVDHLPDTELLPSPLPYFESKSVRWHGVSLINPNQEWSMGHFRQLVQAVNEAFPVAKRVILLVGGTGLYQEYATSSDRQLFIPPNEELRITLENQNVEELQQELARLSPEKLSLLNESDRRNPRRLIRAIEIAEFQRLNPISENSTQTSELHSLLTVGLQSDLDTLQTNITRRVEERIQLGALEEVQTTSSRFQNLKLPAFSATGVKDILKVAEGQLELSELTEMWALHEFQYAKRQLTWWKKRTEIQWFDGKQPQAFTAIKELILQHLKQ